MKCGIYCIRNTESNKRYIGYSSNIFKRWNTHLKKLNNNIHKNKLLQEDWTLVGEDHFCFEVLEECSLDVLATREDYWATIFNTHNPSLGYNIVPTASKRPYLKTNYIPKHKRTVFQYNLDGEFIRQWNSMSSFYKSHGISGKCITIAIDKVGATAYGFQWRSVFCGPKIGITSVYGGKHICVYCKTTMQLLYRFPCIESCAKFFKVNTKTITRTISGKCLNGKMSRKYHIIFAKEDNEG